ncbi:putative 26S proteasome non-ATPase regulatory subunit 8 [Trichinella spiralis]|uniref:putative 26S proteasome non-ATPase regulatory subunit 8 n=1 Tax=Trichinella spiralis TaxID=6334 RepID=UPI0001EFB6B8|nr:putative 26S proteasome non-ATPase regulatory subunit 8 [Trichinella spiralis]
MAVCIENLRIHYKTLVDEWDKKREQRDLNKLRSTVEQLKTAFIEVSFLPTSKSHDLKDEIFVMQRHTLEISVLLSVLEENADNFERSMLQLKHYYADKTKAHSNISRSPVMCEMLGLNLMYLLSSNNLSQFHEELARIDLEVAQNNIYIHFPLFLSKESPPSPYYAYFIETLLCSAREAIAKSLERAYRTVSKKSAQKLLLFSGPEAESRLDCYAVQKGWKMNEARNAFIFDVDESYVKDRTVDCESLMDKQFGYAKQLDMIV